VTALAADPTSVDVGALARENFPDSQQDTRQALIGAAQTAIAQAGDKTAAGYGPGFWQAFNRVTAADGDPNRIGDPAELLRLAGPDGGGALTMAGVQQLQPFLDQNKTVEGRAQSAMEQNFLRQAHAAITGTEDVADPAAEARFQNFLGAYFPTLKDGLAAGKSATQLLSAASANYLGKLVPAFAPPAAPQPATAAPATADRRDKDIETSPDNRSFWERWGDAARSWNEDRQAQLQNVDPVLTRQLARRLGSLGEDDAGVIIVPDSRGILDKTIRFDPTKHVILGNDIYERVPEAEESPLLSGARAFLGGLGPGPLGPSKLAGVIKAGPAAGAGGRAAEAAGAAAQGARTAEAAGAEAQGARTAEVTDQAAAGERGVPGAQAGTGTPLSSLSKEQVEALRPTVRLPKFKFEEDETSATLFTNEGKIVEFKSANPEAYGNYIGATHAEGKAAVWIRKNNSSGGVLFHNNPGGTCGFCNSHLPTLLPKDVRLWVVPPANAVAKKRGWIDYAKPYDGNSAEPLPPKAEE
jgi:hypothetical protein